MNKTRIAPTPSGYLHVGNIFSFVLTVAMARRAGASVLLRIDDLDRERVSRVFVEDIFETLRFLEIPWDEGPADADEFENRWSQAHRMGVYERALEKLRVSGALFSCGCSRSQLAGENVYPGTCRDSGFPLDAEEVNWRLRTDGARVLRVNTFPTGVIEATLPAVMTDFVVRKKDGYPAYQLASVADDVYFGVDFIVRGADLLDSTLAQLYLADVAGLLGFEKTTFFHHGLLTDVAGDKMSKSAGATSVQYLRRQGLQLVEIFSLIARLAGKDARAADWKELAALLMEDLVG